MAVGDDSSLRSTAVYGGGAVACREQRDRETQRPTSNYNFFSLCRPIFFSTLHCCSAFAVFDWFVCLVSTTWFFFFSNTSIPVMLYSSGWTQTHGVYLVSPSHPVPFTLSGDMNYCCTAVMRLSHLRNYVCMYAACKPHSSLFYHLLQTAGTWCK